MLADRIFGAPERRDPPRRKKQPARARKRAARAARGRAAARRDAASLARGRAAPPRPDRPRPASAWRSTSGFVLYLGWDGGTVGDGSQTALAYAVGAGAIVVPVALGLAGVGADPAAVPALAAVGRGGRRAIAAGCCSPSRPRPPASAPRRAPQGPLRAGLLHAITAGASARSSTGRRTTLFQRLGAHILAVAAARLGRCCCSPGRSVSDMVRAGRRGVERAKRGTVGFATAIKESRVSTDPDLIDTDPGRHRARLRPARAGRGWRRLQVAAGGRERETEPGRELRRGRAGRRRARRRASSRTARPTRTIEVAERRAERDARGEPATRATARPRSP